MVDAIPMRSQDGLKTHRPLRVVPKASAYPDPHGKYILTIGLPGSGKSLFHGVLLHYLDKGRDFQVQPASEDSRVHLVERRRDWQQGRFVAAAAKGTPKEYAYKITPLPKGKFTQPLVFRFHEISGADLSDKVVYEPEKQQTLWPEIKALLNSCSGKLVIVLMCDGGNLPGNDGFFVDFLSYVQKSMTRLNFANLKKRVRIMLVISKPEEAEALLHEKGPGSEKPVTEAMINHFLPQTRKQIELNWSQKPLMARLSLGTIASVEEDGEEREVLVTPDFKHMEAIFERIYYHLTGASALRRALDRLRE